VTEMKIQSSNTFGLVPTTPSSMKRRTCWTFSLILCIPPLLLGCCLERDGPMMVNPRFAEKTLVGLTSAQVVERLGPASFDPRLRSGWTAEETDGPLVLGYFEYGATCRIEFKNDRVINVERYWK
jgi:hypothetical protein